MKLFNTDGPEFVKVHKYMCLKMIVVRELQFKGFNTEVNEIRRKKKINDKKQMKKG